MRPELLFPLFAPLTSLKGVGPRLAEALGRLVGGRVVDLLWHLPHGVIDRRPVASLSMAQPGQVITLKVTVSEHAPSKNRKAPYRVYCQDVEGEMLTLVFFNAAQDYLQRSLPVGEARVVSGMVERFTGHLQIAHPDYMVPPKKADEIPAYEPVYGLTQGLTNKRLRHIIEMALAHLPDLPEWLDTAFAKREVWPTWREAIEAVHHPKGPLSSGQDHSARRRLAYDELFASQLALALIRDRARKRRGQRVTGNGKLRREMTATLPFALTGAQNRAISEIATDMGSEHAMLRLLQGDVGSGKTVVALSALLLAVEAGGQAAMLAPTEILARQHFATLEKLAPKSLRMALLTGRDKGKKRAALLDELRAGKIDIIVGTHALLQEDVQFRRLLLAVIDEQHRFGVHQRLTLAAKGEGKLDVLVMTATPIPRTLTLALYGEMDVSRLEEKPPGRQKIDTRVVALNRLHEVIEAIRRAVARGERVFWVCPLVEESMRAEMAAAEARFADLQKYFGAQIGLIHGRMKAADKDKVMEAFVEGRISVLVSTTVIEVGVDVPEATIMVVEEAERFGLAQLHQLRGRIGRGAGHSVCLLLRSENLSQTARQRLEILRDSDDGFRIAEEDLRLRGTGELLGTKQSGFPEFRIADIARHSDLLATAQDDARLMANQDAMLSGPRGQACRILLYLFERDAAVRLLHSG